MKDNKKTIIIIIAIIVVLIVALIVAKVLKNKNEDSSNSNNNVVAENYDKSKVAFSGTQSISGDGYTGTYDVDVVFEDDGYSTTYHLKKVMNYDQKLDDDKVKEILNELDNLTIGDNSDKYNLKGTTDLGLTTFGFDTLVTRNGNTITITGYQSEINGRVQLTDEDKENIKKNLENQGFTINQ